MIGKKLLAAFAATLAAGTLTALGPVGTASAATTGTSSPASFGWCDGRNPSGHSDPTTLRSAFARGALLELRYSPSARCAWGRLNRAYSTDSVWVDRSFDGGSTWDGPLGTVQGNTYTIEFDDADVMMRACTNHGGAYTCTAFA